MNRTPDHSPNPRRLYRDVEHGVIAGVCAGIADYFGISVRALRWVVVLGFTWLRSLPVTSFIGAYVRLDSTVAPSADTEQTNCSTNTGTKSTACSLAKQLSDSMYGFHDGALPMRAQTAKISTYILFCWRQLLTQN